MNLKTVFLETVSHLLSDPKDLNLNLLQIQLQICLINSQLDLIPNLIQILITSQSSISDQLSILNFIQIIHHSILNSIHNRYQLIIQSLPSHQTHHHLKLFLNTFSQSPPSHHRLQTLFQLSLHSGTYVALQSLTSSHHASSTALKLTPLIIRVQNHFLHLLSSLLTGPDLNQSHSTSIDHLKRHSIVWMVSQVLPTLPSLQPIRQAGLPTNVTKSRFSFS